MILVLISNVSPDVKFGTVKIVTVLSSDCVWSQILHLGRVFGLLR